MATTERHKKKVIKKAPVAQPDKQPLPEKKAEITFGLPIETDKLKVTFEGTTVTYFLKETKESYSKDYENDHAIMIIYGRIVRNPHGEYAQSCIAKAKIEAMKRNVLL